MAEKPVSHPAAAKPARTPTHTATPPLAGTVPVRGAKFGPGQIVATPLLLEASRASGDIRSRDEVAPGGIPKSATFKAELVLGPSIRHPEQCHALGKPRHKPTYWY